MVDSKEAGPAPASFLLEFGQRHGRRRDAVMHRSSPTVDRWKYRFVSNHATLRRCQKPCSLRIY